MKSVLRKTTLIKALLVAGLATGSAYAITIIVPPPQAGAPEAEAPRPSAAMQPGSQMPVMPLQNAQTYICNDGEQITLDHDKAAGILRVVRAGRVFPLQEQVGKTPQLFVDGADTLAMDGETVHLVRGRIPRVQCTLVPAAIEPGVVWGTLNLPEGVTLPARARAKILLVDAARADAPAVEIASQELNTSDNQPPLHYLIKYDAARGLTPAGPQLQARIETPRGKLLYITDTANHLPNDGSAPASPVRLDLIATQKAK